ncbi:MAG: beta-N-acetylhexosaminidase [Nitrococcus sp.]|nr:beta-N-acetylhexosaminidase [Nitrococcus sp.]
MPLGPIMIGIRGPTLTPEERELLGDPRIGGVLLFTRNYESVEQLGRLTASIHAMRQPPLLIAVDQEGGCVQRFRAGFTTLPAPGRLGKLYDYNRREAVTAAEHLGWLMAAELRALGVDLSFAPVLDVERGVSRVIGARAFHHRPQAVAELALGWIRGMHQAGMAAVGKHFPGHGAVVADSHHELPVDDRPFYAISKIDLLPFKRLIAAGLEGIMTAHVLYPRVDEHPASFSPVWIANELRERLGFAGAVISDDLGMRAAAGVGDLHQRVSAALASGCDLLLLGNELDAAASAVDRIPNIERPDSAQRLLALCGAGRVERMPVQRDPRWQPAVALATQLCQDGSPEIGG